MRDVRTKMKLLCIAIVCLHFGCSHLLAHSDPRGDVHPIVTVEGSSFVVRASSNVVANETIHSVFDQSGRKNEEIRKVATPPDHVPYRDYSFIDRLAEEQNGLERPWGGSTIIIPEWSRKHGGQPYIIKYGDNEFKYHRLLWTKPDVYQVVDALVVGDSLYLLVTRFTSDNDPQLFFHRFSLKTFAEVSAIELPRPCLIWSFPVCSNIIQHEEKVYVGIVVPRIFGYQLLLAGWDGKSPSLERRVLSTQIDWNTSISLANIGNNALIAYHYPGEYPRWPFYTNPRNAKIRTIPFKLK